MNGKKGWKLGLMGWVLALSTWAQSGNEWRSEKCGKIPMGDEE